MSGVGFGRRIIEPGQRALTVVPESQQGLRADLSGRGDMKERVREKLLSLIDPVVAAQYSRRALRATAGLVALFAAATTAFSVASPSDTQVRIHAKLGHGSEPPLLQPTRQGRRQRRNGSCRCGGASPIRLTFSRGRHT